MACSNKTYYKRNKGFSGSLLEWFNKCVDNEDVFRTWYKVDAKGLIFSFARIISILELTDGDYLLGLLAADSEDGKELISYERLSAISAFALVSNEEDYN